MLSKLINSQGSEIRSLKLKQLSSFNEVKTILMLRFLQNIFDSHVNLLRAMLEKSPIGSLQLSVINHTALHKRVTSSSRLL